MIEHYTVIQTRRAVMATLLVVADMERPEAFHTTRRFMESCAGGLSDDIVPLPILEDAIHEQLDASCEDYLRRQLSARWNR